MPWIIVVIAIAVVMPLIIVVIAIAVVMPLIIVVITIAVVMPLIIVVITIAVVMPLIFPRLFLGWSLSSVRLLSSCLLSSCPSSSLISSAVGCYHRSGYCRHHYYICRHALCVFTSLPRWVAIVDRVIGIIMTTAVVIPLVFLFLGGSLSSFMLLSSYLLSSCPWSSLTSSSVFRYRRSGYCRHHYHCCHHHHHSCALVGICPSIVNDY